jgi:hypothetical protein
MSPARLLAQRLLEAEKPFDPRGFIKSVRPRRAAIDVRIEGPQHAIVRVPVKWYRDLTMMGSHEHPGISLRPSKLKPHFMTEEQWDWILEIIEYAANEGEEIEGRRDPEPDEEGEDEREANAWFWHGAWAWSYVGGKQAYDADYERAYEEAPSYTTAQG